MVLEHKETTIGYRCPHCGAAVISAVGMFALSADMLRLKCPCGESNLTVEYTPDKKIRLTVPCLACPDPHKYMISTALFFSRDEFLFSCPYSGLDICFVGKSDLVTAAMEEAKEELIELLGDTSLESFTEAAHRHKLTDPEIEDTVRFVVADLDAEGRISCDCPPSKGEYYVDFTEDGVLISCDICGAQALLPTDSLSDATAFLNTEKIILK